jgi:type I pantothenate kinase
VETGPLTPLVDHLRAAHAERAPLVVGLGGPVAVGKSTLAAALADALAPRAVAVVGTDGFLLPNAVLIERGLFLRKGFPESYDAAALSAFIARVRSGAPVEVPVYSHTEYDVVDAPRPIGTPEVCIVEGVNALRFAADLDVALYLHAEEEHIVGWYADRFVAQCAAARDDETSFYRGWAELPEAEQRVLAAQFWDSINHPNLVDHIAPTAEAAHAVVVKGADHGIVRLEWRT